MDADEIPGGPGWVIGADLRPRITDAAAFRYGLRADPLVDVVEALWSGDAERALRMLEPVTTARRRALRADCLCALGDIAAARDEYDDLVREAEGTAHEAVMRQHRGKVSMAAGEIGDAIDDFARALELRREGDSASDLVASSAHALRIARRRLEERREGPARHDDAER